MLAETQFLCHCDVFSLFGRSPGKHRVDVEVEPTEVLRCVFLGSKPILRRMWRWVVTGSGDVD